MLAGYLRNVVERILGQSIPVEKIIHLHKNNCYNIYKSSVDSNSILNDSRSDFNINEINERELDLELGINTNLNVASLDKTYYW